MNNDTLDRLIEQVGPALEQLGDGFEHVYHAAVRQAIVAGIIKSVIGLLLVIFAIVVWRVGFSMSQDELIESATEKVDARRRREERYDELSYTPTMTWLNQKKIDVHTDGVLAAWSIAIIAVSMGVGIVLLVTSLDDLINPHWKAVELILDRLR